MTISTSSQASAGSLSLFDGTEDVLECSVKSNHSVSESSQNTGRESLSSETSESSMEPNTEERGFSPEAFLASHSVVPGSGRARKMTVSSGLRCVESYGKHNPNGCWQRMFLASLVKTEAWSSSVCLLTWKMQATKRSRLLFRLAALVLPTEGIGCGLLPTPKSSEVLEDRERFVERNGDRGMGCYPNLMTQIAMLPSPRAGNPGSRPNGKGGKILAEEIGKIAMLLTPATRDYKGANGTEHMQKDRPHMDQLPNAIAHGANHGLKLQPGFALWMMGYPEDWCDLKDGE